MVKYIIVMVMLFSGLIADDALAKRKCVFKNTATVGIKFEGNVDKAVEVQSSVDKEQEVLRQMAEKAGADDVSVKSQKIKIDTKKGGQSYTYKATLELIVSPSDKALVFLDDLKSEQYQASVKVNGRAAKKCD